MGWGMAMRFFLLGAGLLVLWMLIWPAEAAPRCGVRDSVTSALKGQYKESQRVTGVVNSVTVMEIYVSPGGTWTVIFTMHDGRSCIVASGQSWHETLQGRRS